jgi:type II restriction enzyme
MTFDYFVDWKKVLKNVEDIKIGLNTLNALIGADNFEEMFIKLIKKDPELIKLIPIILVRDGHSNGIIKILNYDNFKFNYKIFDFKKKILTNEDIKLYLEFIEKTGLKEIIQKEKIKNFVDYVIGVEAGLNSNARKNRSGTIMENMVENLIKDFCLNNGFKYIIQADSKKIFNNFGVEVPVYIDKKGIKKERKYDFAVKTKTKLYLIECNFYSGGGSKLKATAEEYETLGQKLKNDNFNFIWITDGAGWLTTKIPLQKAFENIDFLINLQMIEDGILYEIIK